MTSSEPFDRSGPVPAAVRAAGYVSEEEVSDEEDGSSVEEQSEEESESEEEDDVEEAPAPHHHHHHPNEQQQVHGHTHPTQTGVEETPVYTAPPPALGIQTGANGYPVDKKGGGAGPSGDRPAEGVRPLVASFRQAFC